MRKLLWWTCVLSVWFTLAAINLAADYACNHPDSFVGRCVVQGYQTNERLIHGCKSQCRWLFGTQGAAIRVASAAAQSSGTRLCTPAPTPQSNVAAEPTAVVSPPCQEAAPARLSGRIVIEQEPAPVRIIAAPSEEECEVPELDTSSAADPAIDLRMPYADETDSSATVEGEGCCASWLDLVPWLKSALLQISAQNQPKTHECETPDLKYPGCPFTGDCTCPRLRPACPPTGHEPKESPESLFPSLEMQKNKGTHFEEKFEQSSSGPMRSPVNCSVLERLRMRANEDTPPHAEIDTTEFRPSDAYPYRIGPMPY